MAAVAHTRYPDHMSSRARLRFQDWIRLTHGGRRTPMYPFCSECGLAMTNQEMAEYEGMHFLEIIEHPPVDREEARRMYEATIAPTSS